ncbi:MAG: hypothetical protein ABIJ96_15580 [Elusimicrobiota bacterium]
MAKLDVFESVFKRAMREPYEYQEVHFPKVLLVTDLVEKKALPFAVVHLILVSVYVFILGLL